MALPTFLAVAAPSAPDAFAYRVEITAATQVLATRSVPRWMWTQAPWWPERYATRRPAATAMGQPTFSSARGQLASAGQADRPRRRGVRVRPVGTTWTLQTLQTKRLSPNPAGRAFFGDLVAIDGDTVLASSYDAAQNTRSAYVFVRSGATWTAQTKLTAADGDEDGSFGRSPALDGNTAVMLDWDGPDPRGQAHSSSGVAFDEFGTDVDVSGPVIVLAAFGAHPSDSEAA